MEEITDGERTPGQETQLTMAQKQSRTPRPDRKCTRPGASVSERKGINDLVSPAISSAAQEDAPDVCLACPVTQEQRQN